MEIKCSELEWANLVQSMSVQSDLGVVAVRPPELVAPESPPPEPDPSPIEVEIIEGERDIEVSGGDVVIEFNSDKDEWPMTWTSAPGSPVGIVLTPGRVAIRIKRPGPEMFAERAIK